MGDPAGPISRGVPGRGGYTRPGMKPPARTASWCLIPALAALALSCSRTPEPDDASILLLLRTVDSLRVEGRFPEALAVAERLESLAAGPGARPWHRVEARRLSSTVSLILSLPADARGVTAAADSLTPVIRDLLDVAEDFVAAADAASRQLQIRSRHLGHDHPDVGATLEVLGEIAHRSSELAKAEVYYERALAVLEEALGPDHPRVAGTLHLRGRLRRELGGRIMGRDPSYVAGSESDYLDALSLLESSYPKDDPALVPLLQSFASLRRSQRRFDEGESMYQRSLRILRRHEGSRSVRVADNLLWLGFCRIGAGWLEPAEEALLEAREIYAEHGMGGSHRMGDATWFLGNLAWLRDDYARATAFWREWYPCRTDMPETYPQGYGQIYLRGVVGQWIDALLHEGREEEAWREVCRESAPVTRSLMNLSAARRAGKAEAAGIDSLRAEVVDIRRELTDRNATGNPPLGDRSTDSLLVRLSRIDAERMLRERELMARVVPSRPDSLTTERIQALLGPEQALVGWIMGIYPEAGGMIRRSLWAFVLRRQGRVRWVHLGTKNDNDHIAWAAGAQRYEKTLVRSSQWPHRVPPDPKLDALAADVWRQAFAPLMPHLDGIEELVVIDGQSSPVLFWPFRVFPECLLDAEGVPMGERFAFSYVPSPALFVHMAETGPAGRPPGERPMVAVADPGGGTEGPLIASADPAWDDLLQGADAPGPTLVEPALFRSAVSGGREALARLPRLPHSRTEVQKAASGFRTARVLVGSEANEATLAAVLGRGPVGVLHLATHALIDVLEPGRSALVLSDGRDDPGGSRGDGLITAEEVLLGWNLEADLVTLSGCQTNEGTASKGGEELGFAQAFFAAGARGLLMSRWKVDDRATALLMGRFYENWTGSYGDVRAGRTGVPMTAPRALQEAQLWLRGLRDEGGSAPFAHPVYWAGFVLWGNPD